MNSTRFLWFACLAAALWPVFGIEAPGHRPSPSRHTFPGWPETFGGKPWIRLTRSKQAAAFAAGFAGKTAVFTQREQTVVLRWIEAPSRGVHPAEDCFRARGYAIERSGLVRDEDGVTWAEFGARRGEEALRVRERLTTTVENGETWTDVSAWYWAAQRSSGEGPWWAITVASPLITAHKS